MDLYFIYIRMLQTRKESMPDDESYELVVDLCFDDCIDLALRYVDLTLKFGYMLSMRVFECVRSCVNKGGGCFGVYYRECVMTMDRIKLFLLRNMCIFIADITMQENNSKLGTAGRTYNSTLLDASWAILRRSLRQKKAPQPESYLAKIYADARLGICRAFSTLHEFETAYRNSPKKQMRIYSHLYIFTSFGNGKLQEGF
ncbi:hypothetical protein AAG906_017657 [Vitis piasezkii]